MATHPLFPSPSSLLVHYSHLSLKPSRAQEPEKTPPACPLCPLPASSINIYLRLCLPALLARLPTTQHITPSVTLLDSRATTSRPLTSLRPLLRPFAPFPLSPPCQLASFRQRQFDFAVVIPSARPLHPPLLARHFQTSFGTTHAHADPKTASTPNPLHSTPLLPLSLATATEIISHFLTPHPTHPSSSATNSRRPHPTPTLQKHHPAQPPRWLPQEASLRCAHLSVPPRALGCPHLDPHLLCVRLHHFHHATNLHASTRFNHPHLAPCTQGKATAHAAQTHNL